MSAATQLPEDADTLSGTPSPDPSADTCSHRHLRSFMVIQAAQLVARVGNGLTAFGLGVYVYQQSGLNTTVSLVTLATFLPSLLLSPFGGVLADRYDRRLLMIFGDTFSVLGLLAMIVASHTNFASVPIICVCMALSLVFSSVMGPAYRATVTDLLTPEQYARVEGLVQLASASQYLISPAIAELLMASSGITTVLTIGIATMVLTVACTLLVWRTVKTPPHRTTTGFRANFRQGISFLRQHSGITALMVPITMATFCMGFLQALLTPTLFDLTDESTLDAIHSVAAVGMIVANLIIGMFNMKGTHLTYITCFLAAGGVLIFLLRTTTSILAIGVLTFAFFMALPPLNMSVEVIARSSIPNETQGKVWGLVGLISQLGYIVAYAVSGVFVDNVFNPLLREGGALTDSLGALIGVGTSRGVRFMPMTVGVLLIGMVVAIPHARNIRSLQNNLPLTEKKGM